MSGPTRAQFEPCGFFLLRAPLLSIDIWSRWAGDDTFDTERLRTRLRTHVQRPEVREALAVASDSLLAGVPQWLEDPSTETGQKVERALVRYLCRMSARPTPFGLFAGCAVGTIGEHTRVRVGPISEHRRHTRIDNDQLDRLGRRLTTGTAYRHLVRLEPNTSLHALGGKLRYVEPQRSDQGRTHNLVALDDNPYLAVAIERAKTSATALQIADAVVQFDDEIDRNEALEFVDSLVDSAVLVSELEPSLTGPEPLHQLIDSLERIDSSQPATCALRDVRDALQAADRHLPFRPQQSRYDHIRDLLASVDEDSNTRPLLQVDMQLAAEEAVLDGRVVPELVEAATRISEFCPFPPETQLQSFCRRFEERYERREVPLLEVLDEDCGIGFGKLRPEGNDPEPLLAGVNVPLPPAAGTTGRSWGPFEEMLAGKLEALGPGEELTLDSDDFASLPRRDASLPDSCILNVTFAAQSPQAMRDQAFRPFLHLVDGPSGANWLGRFCHADPQLESWTRRLIRDEEALRPDAVFAEIVHLPEGRTGNVLLRPTLRDYEIPYLGRSGAPADRQLPPDDLVVTVWDGRVILKSKRLQREVIPRLSSAHAFPNPTNIGLYRFLGALQTRGESIRTAWSWGALDATATYLPRVSIGRVVVSLARWALKRRHLQLLDHPSAEQRWSGMQELRTQLSLPRRICIADGDNLLPVDLDNRLLVESAAHLLRRRPGANLVEMFPEPSQTWVESEQGPLCHEMLIPITRTADSLPERASLRPWLASSDPTPVRRLAIPGSEWMYLKLFASPRSCDLALLGLADTIAELQATDAVTRWFFVRMADPEGWHLRLRFQGPPRALWGTALPVIRRVLDPMVERGLVWKVQVESYRREVEHWGGAAGIELGEQFLSVDSRAVLDVLQLHRGDPQALAEARWRLGLRGVDGLWDALGLDFAARRRLAIACRASFQREFGTPASLEKRLSHRYRGVRASIDELLGVPGILEPTRAPGGRAIFDRRDRALEPVFAEFRSLERSGRLNRPVQELAHRFSHLHLNRILRSMLREQELVTMDFLSRYYRSAEARVRKLSRRPVR